MTLLSNVMSSGAYQEADRIHKKVIEMKEPLLRKILSGESISEKENGYLEALSDVEHLIEERKQSIEKDEESVS